MQYLKLFPILLQLTKSSPGAQWIVPQVSPDTGTFWKRVSPISNSSSSPSHPHSLREALAQAQSAGRGGGRPLKESLHPMLRRNWLVNAIEVLFRGLINYFVSLQMELITQVYIDILITAHLFRRLTKENICWRIVTFSGIR
jgi:hypothetical protein